MVTSLRQRIALAVLLGVMAIPLVTSNLGGIGQLLVCETEVEQHFAATLAEGGAAVTSSRVLDEGDAAAAADDGPVAVTRGDDPRTLATSACGGVTAEISAQPLSTEDVRLVVTIQNETRRSWRGTVGLELADGGQQHDLTTTIGDVPAGGSRSDDIILHVPSSQAEIGGRIYLGP